MGRTQTETLDCLAAEWRDSEALFRSLTAEDLDRPTRCEGLTVRGVAAHAAGVVADIPTGKTGLHTTPDHVAAREGWTAAQLADEIAEAAPKAEAFLRSLSRDLWDGPSPIDGMSVGIAVEAGILESVVHCDDVRAAIGRAPARTAGVPVTIDHVVARLAARGWGPYTVALDGMDPIAAGDGGATIAGDQWEFLLAATGRGDPAKLGLDDSVNIFG